MSTFDLQIIDQILRDCLDLHEERLTGNGLRCYSTIDGTMRTMLIATEEDLDRYYHHIDVAWRKKIHQMLRRHMGFISRHAVSARNRYGKCENFANQFFLDPQIDNVISKLEKRCTPLTLPIDAKSFAPLYVVAYICHELRHLVQMFHLHKKDLFDEKDLDAVHQIPQIIMIREKIPPLNWDKNKKMYLAHYATHPLRDLCVQEELDAFVIQLRVLDHLITCKDLHNINMTVIRRVLHAKNG